MFERVSLLHDARDNCMPNPVQESMVSHLATLEEEFKCYFPEVSNEELNVVRNPFRCSVDETPDELIDLHNNSGAKDLFEDKTITDFWPVMVDSYPKVAKRALCVLLPFVSTYLCESGFSTLILLKTKQRNRLKVEDDMRCALSQTSPRIDALIKVKQSQISH